MLQSGKPKRNAIVAALAIGAAVAVSSFSVVRAEHAGSPQKSKSCSSSNPCQTYTNNGNGPAFEGKATANSGVYGSSSGGVGLYGDSTLARSAGVRGTMQVGYGSWSESSDNTGNISAALVQGHAANTAIFYGENTANSSTDGDAHCKIDPNANLICTGTVSGSNLSETHINVARQRVLTYAAQSTSASLEDVGTARLAGGVANIALDPAFAATIDRSRYHVFVTADGDASLYVAQKTAAGFVVRETRSGRSTLDFEYRIVARPGDAAVARLPLAPLDRPMAKPRAR
jgi:hypothetical protein